MLKGVCMQTVYISENENLICDWNWVQNDKFEIYPDKVSIGSRKRVYWKCHFCGGEWDTIAKYRAGCPYCTGLKALQGFNDLQTKNSELALEWDYEKNGELTPAMVTPGSKKKVWWLCEKGHSWDMYVYSRAKGQGCPICNNRRILTGYNDLQTVRPDLAEEWHPVKNQGKTPSEYVYGSREYVWWQCEKGHEWKAQIIRRTGGTGCPVCANHIVMKNYNDFASAHPELVDEWDYGRNEKKPEDYGCYSREKVWWICKRGHHFKAVIGDRSKGNGCAKCTEERRVSLPEKTILYYLQKYCTDAIGNYRKDWLGSFELDMFLKADRIAIEYDGEYGHSTVSGKDRDLRKNKLCAEHGVTLIRIREPKCPELNDTSIDYMMKDRNDLKAAIVFVFEKIKEITGKTLSFSIDNIDFDRDSGEIFSLIEYAEKENSLLEKYPHIAAMWNQEKNGKLTPGLVNAGSSKKVWWLGACGHEWRSAVSYEVFSGKCPYCSGMRVLIGFNDLQTVNPELAGQWNYEKNNGAKPEEYTVGSGKKVWWNCSNGHSWKASVVSRNRGNGCPVCSNHELLAGCNDVGSNQSLLVDWDYENNEKAGRNPRNTIISLQKKVNWKCHVCGEKWSVSPARRIAGTGCPKCAQGKRRQTVQTTYVRKSGSLKEKNPELMKEWDWNKNSETDPELIVPGNGSKVWWICRKCNHTWQATVASRVQGRGCPCCARVSSAEKRQQKILQSKKSIIVTQPEIMEEWDYEKNTDILPENITAGSGKRAWWKCKKCGASWNAVIGERTRGRVVCPKCRKH